MKWLTVDQSQPPLVGPPRWPHCATTFMTTQWRASGPYVASSALFGGVLEETKLYLAVWAEQTGTVAERAQETGRILVEGGLLQRARSSRRSVVQRIQTRLTSWSPPAWVLDDLAVFAQPGTTADLQAALLIHVCRQDTLLYTLVQELILPRWRGGQPWVTSGDVQQFLDRAISQHPEIEGWTFATRDRLGTMTLTLLRDYGLLQGKARKHIVEPRVSDPVAHHLARLLRAEGIGEQELPFHPDWQLWLWEPERVQRRLALPTPP